MTTPTPKAVADRVMREFRRYTADGLSPAITGADLPVGDPSSGPHSPSKRELREMAEAMQEGVDLVVGAGLTGAVQAAAEDAADRAEAAADAVALAATSVGAFSASTLAAALTAGLSGTTLGDTFTATGDDVDYVGLYTHASGPVATEIARLPTQAQVNAKAEATDVAPLTGGHGGGAPDAVAPLVSSQSGEVPVGVRLSDGALVTGRAVVGGVETREVEIPGMAVAWGDAAGNVAWGLREDGTTLPAPPVDHEVFTAGPEIVADPSREVYLTWISNSEGARLASVEVAGVWASYASEWTRPFPDHSPALWVHSARVTGLQPGTTYRYAIPGGGWSDRFRTCPAGPAVRLAWAADWQSNDLGPASLLGTMGDQLSALEPDLLMFGGDFLDQDQRRTQEWAERWLALLVILRERYRTVGGAQVPVAALLGNHDGGNSAMTSHADHNGNGFAGTIASAFAWGYSPLHPTRFAESAATWTLPGEIGFIGLNTDHTVPIASQVAWFTAQAAAMGGLRHVFVGGHVSPFNTYATQYTRNQARVQRESMWAAVQDQGNVRAWLYGHAHAMSVLPALKVDTSESDNSNRFFRHAAGIRGYGGGPWGDRQLVQGAATLARVSEIDTEPFWSAVLHELSNGNLESLGTGITNASEPIAHVWVLDIDADGWRARAVNHLGTLFFDQTVEV